MSKMSQLHATEMPSQFPDDFDWDAPGEFDAWAAEMDVFADSLLPPGVTAEELAAWRAGGFPTPAF
jgi:hypothetical protein